VHEIIVSVVMMSRRVCVAQGVKRGIRKDYAITPHTLIRQSRAVGRVGGKIVYTIVDTINVTMLLSKYWLDVEQENHDHYSDHVQSFPAMIYVLVAGCYLDYEQETRDHAVDYVQSFPAIIFVPFIGCGMNNCDRRA
jgi:hypothetical protein